MTKTILLFKDEEHKHKFTETSSFDILIPSYRLDDINNVFKELVYECKNIKLDLTKEENKLTISTTEQTRDPYIIIKARDMLQLLARGV